MLQTTCAELSAGTRLPKVWAVLRAGLVLYLVYLVLEKALVGWVTILVELAVAVALLVYKLWLDHFERCPLRRA